MVGALADEAAAEATDQRSRAAVVVVGGGAIGADGRETARFRVLRVPLGDGGGEHLDELERSDGARVFFDRLHVRLVERHVDQVDEVVARAGALLARTHMYTSPSTSLSCAPSLMSNCRPERSTRRETPCTHHISIKTSDCHLVT